MSHANLKTMSRRTKLLAIQSRADGIASAKGTFNTESQKVIYSIGSNNQLVYEERQLHALTNSRYAITNLGELAVLDTSHGPATKPIPLPDHQSVTIPGSPQPQYRLLGLNVLSDPQVEELHTLLTAN